jgi:hypothetical protein
MTEQIDTDQIADATVIEPSVADAPTELASVAELMAWRAVPTTKSGNSFVYFAGPSLLMITRSRDIAVDRIAAAVWSMYHESGRVVPVSQRNGVGWVYSVQAVDNAPKAVVIPQPVNKSKAALTSTSVRSP